MARSSGRWSRFLKSSVDALLAPAEDPRTAFADPAQQQQALLDQLRTAQLRLAASRSRLESRRSEATEQLDHLDDQARNALIVGREDIARLALRRQLILQEELAHLDRQVTALQREETQLLLVEQRLKVQIEAIRSRKQMAEARRTAAEAQVTVGEVLSGAGVSSTDTELIGRIERDAEELEARAGAIEELINAGILGVGSEIGTKALDESDAEIEERLAALKRSVTRSQS